MLIWSNGRFVRGSEGLPHPVLDDDGRGSDALTMDVDDDGDLDLVIGRDESGDNEQHTRVFLNPRIR